MSLTYTRSLDGLKAGTTPPASGRCATSRPVAVSHSRRVPPSRQLSSQRESGDQT